MFDTNSLNEGFGLLRLGTFRFSRRSEKSAKSLSGRLSLNSAAHNVDAFKCSDSPVGRPLGFGAAAASRADYGYFVVGQARPERIEALDLSIVRRW